MNALFVRNVNLTFNEAEEYEKAIDKEVNAGGNMSLGLFSAGGNYKTGLTTKEVKKHRTGNTLTIEGIQLVGLLNNFVPKSPDPNPELKPEDFT